MVSTSNPLRKELKRCMRSPASISSKDLFKLSLRELSSSLPQVTPSRTTFSIYLRWLEVHRQQPSKLTEHWQNTLLHWTQSLRSRGFLESEIIRTVEDWKEANGPFHSQDRRYPPTPKDISMAFDEMEKKYRADERVREESLADRLDRPLGDPYRLKDASIGSGSLPSRLKHDSDKGKRKKHRADNFEGKPPANYICNRCGHKGHHLQVCPTNMDPTYDKPPPDDYECDVCKARGKHFKSLCPRNTNPYSIIQKRRQQGIKTPHSYKGSVFRKNEKDVDHQNVVERFDPWSEPNDGRLSKAPSSISTESSSPNPSLKDQKQQMLERIDDMRSTLVKMDSAGSVDIDELMAEGRFDEDGQNDRKRFRMHDQSDSSSRDASPGSCAGRPRLKKARMSDRKEIATSPRGETDFADSPFYTPHSRIGSPGDILPGSANMFKTDNSSFKEVHGSGKRQREEGRTEEGAAREKRVRTETSNSYGTKNGVYAGATDDDPPHTHRLSIRGLPESAQEQEEEGAVRMNQIRRTPPGERQINKEDSDLYHNDEYCASLGTDLSSPYFHDPNARKATLEENQNRRHFAEHKINPDALSIHESDTDISDDIEVELAPKRYSNFVQRLMCSRPKMCEIVNVVKKRPTAVEMWKIDDQRRMEQMIDHMPDLNEPSPSDDRLRFEEAELTPTSYTSEPCRAYVRVFRSEYSQLDGAGDESPVDDNKVSQRKSSSSDCKNSPRKGSSSENRPSIHRRISNMGKEAIEKVKELTTYVAEDLQALKSKASSPFRSPSHRADELSPTKLKKKITANTKTMDESNPGGSLHSLKVNAAKSALSLTEERVKGLAQSNATTVSHASQNSFGSLEVNLPGDRPQKPRKPPTSNPFAQYAGRQGIETLQNCDSDQIEIMLQENLAIAKREASTTSDATDLQINEEQTGLAGKCRALPEGTKSSGSGLSDVTNVGKT